MSAAIQGDLSQSGNNNFLFTKNNIKDKKEYSLSEILTSDKTKRIINTSANGTASLFSLLTFLNGNFNLLDSIQEKLEPFSEALSKIAFSTVHTIGALALWQKKNIFPFLGYAMAPVIALFSSGYNLWVSTGLSGGLINFAVITDQREVVDENGNPILGKNGEVQIINGDFKERGWRNSLETTLKESFKMIKELFKDPYKITKFAHATFVSSSSLIIGSLLGLLGLKKTEAIIRNTASIASETAFLFHKDLNNKSAKDLQKTIDLKSPIVQSGILWICTATLDLLKRFDFISEKISNLTHFSLAFDRAASIRFTQGILNIKHN